MSILIDGTDHQLETNNSPELNQAASEIFLKRQMQQSLVDYVRDVGPLKPAIVRKGNNAPFGYLFFRIVPLN